MDIAQATIQFPWLITVSALTFIIIFSWSLYFLLKNITINYALFLTQKILRLWGHPLINKAFLAKLVVILPVAAIMFCSRLIPDIESKLLIFIERICLSTILLLIVRAISTFLDNVNTAYSSQSVSRNRPIKGFIQVFLILLYLFTLILIVSILFDRSPLVFLSGLGAMTAVLLLVFRDTLLSLVAGLQLTSNNYIQIGDWIEMPQFGADGDVIDIALHAVRVQNWDKTITVIPTHKFLENSFKNWRGMHESGGRRIKRSINIDMTSINFLTVEEVNKYKNFVLLREYIETKCKELQQHNAQYAHDPELIVNSRRLTNIGTFRAYLINYLKQHPNINSNMTFLVRQLAPNEKGLPIEIYVFTNDTRWAVYEGIQADIFDHVIAMSKEFGLRVFQNPTSYDLKNILTSQK